MHLDISTSIASGLPPLGGSSESQFDTKPISGTDAVSILAIGRYEASMLLRQIVSRMLGINPPRRKDIDELGGKVEELRDRMDELVKRIEGDIERERRARSSGEAVQEWKGSWEDDGPGVVFMEWAKIMLGMLPERAYGVLYQPLLKAKSRKWRHRYVEIILSY